jgi:hypothetical protein
MDKERGMKQHIAPTLKDVIQASLDRGRERNMEERRAAGVFIEPTKANDKQIGGDHYKNMAVEPWDVIDTWPREQRIGAYRAGALKYIMRMGSKDENAQEIGKGLHYLEKLLEVLKEKQ